MSEQIDFPPEALRELIGAFATPEAGMVRGFVLIALAGAFAELCEQYTDADLVQTLASSVERRAHRLKEFLLPEVHEEYERSLQGWLLAVRMILHEWSQ